jgi:hypothetical protein
MTIRGQDFDEAAAYVRTTRTLERLCRDYGFEYVLGVFSNGEEQRKMADDETDGPCGRMPAWKHMGDYCSKHSMLLIGRAMAMSALVNTKACD